MAVKIIPISEMRQKLKDVITTLEATGEPYFITQHSRPKAVLVRYEDYNVLIKQAEEGQARIVRRSDISGGEPIIQGTRISVRHIIERIQTEQSVEDILAALPHLTAAQVYNALSYYYDHQPEIDQLIQESQLEQVIAVQALHIEQVSEGIAIVRPQSEL